MFFIETSHALARMPRKVAGALRRIGEQPGPAGHGWVDIAMADSNRQSRWSVPVGGVLRSGDLEIAVDTRHLRISRDLRTVVLLPFELTRGLVFRTADGTTSLVALTTNKLPQHVLDAADLSAAEWEVVADLIAEATRGRLLLTLDPPGPPR